MIEFFTTVWGGKYSIIVPTDGNTIAAAFWDILECFDPDYLYFYRKTLGDLKISDPEKYSEILDRQVAVFMDQNPNTTADNIREDFDNRLKNIPVSHFRISSELQAVLKQRIAPFWFQEHVVEPGGITASTTGHFQLTDVSKILPNCDHLNDIALLTVTAPGIPAIWYAPTTGRINDEFMQKLRGIGVGAVPFDMGIDRLREIFELVVEGRIDTARSELMAKLEGGDAPSLKDFSAILPFQFSMINISVYQSLEYRVWDEPVVMVAGDTIADFCLYYCLSRLRPKVVWLLSSWITTFRQALARAREGGEQIRNEEMQAFHFAHEVLSLARGGTGQERISILSSSIAQHDLEQMRDTLDEATLSDRGTFRSCSDIREFVADVVRHPCVAFERNNVQRDYAEPMIENRLARPFDTPKPKNFHTIHPYEHRWITELIIRKHRFPAHPSLGTWIVRDHRLGTHGVRSGRNGVSYFCPNFGWFGGDIDWVLVKPEINLPSAFEMFEKLFEEQKYTCRISDKGFYAQETIDDFDGLGPLAETLRDVTRRSVLEKFLDISTSPTEGVFDEGVLLGSDERRYLNFVAIHKIMKDEDKSGALVDDLVRRTVFYRGFVFKCAYCRNADWFKIGDISEEFECKRCGRRQTYVREHWRQPREPAWFYKLDEIVFQGLRNDMIVPILALDFLRRKAKESFLFTHELEVLESGPQRRRSEIDICCIPDGVLTIGEAKKDNRLGATEREEVQAIAKYRDLAQKIGATQVIFATTAAAWSDATVENAKKTFENTPIRLTLLAESELFSA